MGVTGGSITHNLSITNESLGIAGDFCDAGIYTAPIHTRTQTHSNRIRIRITIFIVTIGVIKIK